MLRKRDEGEVRARALGLQDDDEDSGDDPK